MRGGVQEDFDDLDPAWSIAFYRIAQESLTNIAKHAQANKVRVSLAREDGGIRLRIIDDGVGVAEESLSKPKSHGIVGMRERMRQMGGRFQIRKPEEGTGTIVEAFIPADQCDCHVRLKESDRGNDCLTRSAAIPCLRGQYVGNV